MAKTAEHNHQFVEVSRGKSVGNIRHSDVMCAECGSRKRLHEDGRMEVVGNANEEASESEAEKKREVTEGEAAEGAGAAGK